MTIEVATLPAMIDSATRALAGARSAAEILEARELAGVAYDMAKRAARLAKAKDAHDSLIAAAHRAQADALEIEAGAKRRLADEYDGAQERGEVVGRSGGGDSTVLARNAATAAELGLDRKEIHEARIFRDAERVEPGVTKRTITDLLNAGHEPTKTALRQAVVEAARQGSRYGAETVSRKNPLYKPNPDQTRFLAFQRACRDVTELSEGWTLQDFIACCYSERERVAAIKAFDEALLTLQSLMEAADA